jgi:hypothetical protein
MGRIAEPQGRQMYHLHRYVLCTKWVVHDLGIRCGSNVGSPMVTHRTLDPSEPPNALIDVICAYDRRPIASSLIGFGCPFFQVGPFLNDPHHHSGNI